MDYYNYAYIKDPIVHGFIAESGTVFSFSTGKSDNSADWFNASQQLGCSGSDAKASLACMRKKSYQEFVLPRLRCMC